MGTPGGAHFFFCSARLETDAERHWDKLSRDVGEDVMVACFDEGSEAAELKRRADAAVDPEIRRSFGIIDVGLLAVDAAAADEIWANPDTRQRVNEVCVR